MSVFVLSKEKKCLHLQYLIFDNLRAEQQAVDTTQ